MNKKIKDLLFIVGTLLVLLLLYYLSTIGRKPPRFPADETHMAAHTNEDCGACHGKGKAYPVKQGHPFKEQCLDCHKMEAAPQGAAK